ncbi:MAG TPA: SAF domain-containing protein [Ilumatobacter sp.]|nr:SAF domain-containing protein [Ilumatobacter sp.]
MTSTVSPRPDTSIGGYARQHEAKGFRPGSRRRARIAGGAALVAVAIGGNVALYTSLDDRTEVLQVVEDIRAGEVVTAHDLRIVEGDLDPTGPAVAADDLALVVDQYARVHIASGTLLAPVLVQPTPLVGPGSAVVAIELRPTLVPDGLRERSLVELIVTSDGNDGDVEFRTTGRAVTRPVAVDGVSGVVTMSIEVASSDAAVVAAGDDLRVVLIEPGVDPVYDDRPGD